MKSKYSFKFIIIVGVVVLLFGIGSSINNDTTINSNIIIKERTESYKARDKVNDFRVGVKGENNTDGLKVLPVPDITEDIIMNQL